MGLLEKIDEDIRNFWKIVAEAEPESPKKNEKPPKEEKPPKPESAPKEPAADKSSSKNKTDNAPIPPEGGAAEPPVGDMPPPGGGSPGADIFAGQDLGGGAGGGGMDSMPPGGPEGEAGDAEGGDEDKSSIAFYTNKVNSNKIIKNQRRENEPDFDYSILSPEIIKYYNDNYIGNTENGSLIISVPSTDTISLNSYDTNVKFITQNVLPKIDASVKKALQQEKRVVILGSNGLPSYDGDYSQDENGLIAWYLDKKYPEYIIYDTWNPSEYESFISNDKIWKEVKERTGAENLDIKSALYLYLVVSGKLETAKRIHSKSVSEKISEWGIKNTATAKQIYGVAYPESVDEPQTLASYIIKTYLQLLRVNMMQKLLKYEKEGKIVIVLADKNTAWTLAPSFKKSGEFEKEKEEEPTKEEPPAEKEEPVPPEGKEEPKDDKDLKP